MASVMQTDLRQYLHLIASGKVREIYELDDSMLLFVATDRISGECADLQEFGIALTNSQPTM